MYQISLTWLWLFTAFAYLVFPPILQFFPHLINYVAVCKQYTTILSINVYLYKSFSIDVKCKQHRETHTHFSMWGGYSPSHPKLGGVESVAPKSGGGVVCRTQKWGGDPLAAEGRANLGTPPPRDVFGSFP